MSKKNIIIALAAFGLIVIGFLILGQQKPQKEGQTAASSVKNEEECGDNGNCIRDVAVAKQDPNICSKIRSVSDQGKCYSEVAIAKQDESVCSRMMESYEAELYNRSQSVFCYSEVARLKQDASICEKYLKKGDDDACFLDVAKLKQDLSICAKINPTSPYWQDCYRDVGLLKQDPSICDIITDPWKKEDCNYGIFKATNDASICDKLRIKENIEACRRSVK
jgi:hypothetical protein